MLRESSVCAFELGNKQLRFIIRIHCKKSILRGEFSQKKYVLSMRSNTYDTIVYHTTYMRASTSLVKTFFSQMVSDLSRNILKKHKSMGMRYFKSRKSYFC